MMGCHNLSEQPIICNTQPCPSWSEWSDFDQCSKPCETGHFYRSRTCNNGEIGEIGCDGKSSEKNADTCNTQQCPTWNSWGQFDECTRPCLGGQQTRSRTCPGEGCQGDQSQTRDCNTLDCKFFPVENDLTFAEADTYCSGLGGRLPDLKVLTDDNDYYPEEFVDPIWLTKEVNCEVRVNFMAN